MELDQPPPKSDRRVNELRMSFGEHLEDLKKCILRALIGIAVCAVITFYFSFRLIAWIATPLFQAQEATGYPPKTYALDPTAGFTVYLRVALFGALVLASPWVVYQAWRFISAGLYEHEQQVAYILAPFSAIMSLLGIGFTYYILLPMCLVFFFTFSTYYPTIEPGDPGFIINWMKGNRQKALKAEDPPHAAAPLKVPVLRSDPQPPEEGTLWINESDGQIKTFYNNSLYVLAINPDRLLAPYPEIGRFVKFAVGMGLGIVIAFQLPVFMLVLGWTNLFDPAQVTAYRKYCVFACFAAAAVLTPTDLLSMIVLAMPLWGLFELGLVLMKLSYRGDGP